jgi:hypothetical protein
MCQVHREKPVVLSVSTAIPHMRWNLDIHDCAHNTTCPCPDPGESKPNSTIMFI